MTGNELIVQEQRQVAFYEDEITAVRLATGEVAIPIRPICDNLGVTLAGQRERILRDPVLSEEMISVSVTLTQQAREMLCLPLKYIPGWLFGINANRVKPEIRDRLIRYQRECYDVLLEAFQEGRLTADAGLSDLLAGDSDAAQAYQLAVAIMKLARSHVALEGKVGTLEGRLEAVEDLLASPERFVTQDQAMQISQAVKAVAMAWSKKAGANQYGAVYGELYRRYGVTSYKQLPAARFQDVMAWLTDWHETLTQDAF